MTIFWDWNGTILDDLALVIRLNNLVFTRHGYRHTSVEEYRCLFRFPVRDYYTDLGVAEEDFPVIAREWNDLYVRNFAENTLTQGVVDALHRFKAAGFRQVILSASQVDQLRAQVASFPELEGMFDDVLGLGDVYAVSKVQLAKDYLRAQGMDPQDAVFVGDTTHDAEVARAVGCRCFLRSGGHQVDEVLAQAESAQIVRSFADLYPLLGA